MPVCFFLLGIKKPGATCLGDAQVSSLNSLHLPAKRVPATTLPAEYPCHRTRLYGPLKSTCSLASNAKSACSSSHQQAPRRNMHSQRHCLPDLQDAGLAGPSLTVVEASVRRELGKQHQHFCGEGLANAGGMRGCSSSSADSHTLCPWICNYFASRPAADVRAVTSRSGTLLLVALGTRAKRQEQPCWKEPSHASAKKPNCRSFVFSAWNKKRPHFRDWDAWFLLVKWCRLGEHRNYTSRHPRSVRPGMTLPDGLRAQPHRPRLRPTTGLRHRHRKHTSGLHFCKRPYQWSCSLRRTNQTKSPVPRPRLEWIVDIMQDKIDVSLSCCLANMSQNATGQYKAPAWAANRNTHPCLHLLARPLKLQSCARSPVHVLVFTCEDIFLSVRPTDDPARLSPAPVPFAPLDSLAPLLPSCSRGSRQAT